MKFEIYKVKKQWRWRLRAENGEIIASGEAYKNKSDCTKAIDLVTHCYEAVIVNLEEGGGK